jgi:glycerophosphoryl diester phosphodiesterase
MIPESGNRFSDQIMRKTKNALDWLTARPIAHRGLHNAAAGVIENTASAFVAAIAGNFGIETDLQISTDGEAMVHHDDALGRLTEGSGKLAEMTAEAIQKIHFKASADMILTLGDLCELVGSRVTLVLELKSRFDGDLRLAQRAAEVLASYSGPVAVMSFDPVLVEAVRQIAPGLTRGIVAERMPPWRSLLGARPQFIAYGVKNLPALAPLVARWVFGLPLLTWTVRSEEDRRRAEYWADQAIFEGVTPQT